MLQQTFIELVNNYTHDTNLAGVLWEEVTREYSHKKRHYHTLQHLENLLIQLKAVQTHIHNWNTVLFTLFYHDIIYKAHRTNNEEQSALLAQKRMVQLNVSQEIIDACRLQILATKSHNYSQDNDTNFFTDADLSILGQPWAVYEVYYKNVRKEYSVYPDLLYKPGRRKVLEHFLQLPQIFKTAYFYQGYETQARENLRQELGLLQ